MKLLKRMAVLSLVVLALGGCTKSSISTDAPVSGSEEVDPAKLESDDNDETLPRDQNFLVEDETVETTMYDWEQAQSECDGLFNDTSAFPQSVKMEFTYDETALNIGLTWTVKNDTTNDDAMEYAVTMVKQFNDIIAAQSMDLENSSADSFGTLWNQFSLDVKVVTEGGKALVDKSYKAGEKIDLKSNETVAEGPEDVADDSPKKLDETKASK